MESQWTDFVAPSPPKITDASGRLGAQGIRIEFVSTSALTKLERTDTIEVYDDFPNLAILSTAYKNASRSDLKLDKVIAERYELDASLADAKAKPYQMWSFQGASVNWGKDEISPIPARAVAASEILLYAELHLLNDRDHIPVLISRSGLTSEVLDTARMLEKERGLRTIVITCADGQPLESLATVTLKMSPADEKSMVMTRSFTAMLLALQYLAAPVSGNSNSCEALFQLPQQVSPLLQKYPPRLREFVESHRYADYIVNGHLLLPADTACHLISSRYCSQTRILRSPIKDYFVSDHAAGDRTSGCTRR